MKRTNQFAIRDRITATGHTSKRRNIQVKDGFDKGLVSYDPAVATNRNTKSSFGNYPGRSTPGDQSVGSKAKHSGYGKVLDSGLPPQSSFRSVSVNSHAQRDNQTFR